MSEEMLWPRESSVIKTGADREMVMSYPFRSLCPASVWAKLIGGAKKDVIFAGYTNYFLFTQQAAFDRTLKTLSERGVRVRFLMGDPEGRVTREREDIEETALTVSSRIRITLENLARLGDLPGLEARFSAPEDATNHVGLSVFRFDDDALVTPHLARVVGHDSPMMHFRRRDENGMFDRWAGHAEELWERGRPVA
ncbi:XRE family transcriptional regulator [Streptomyces cinereoruber]|uniref:XRE family transcriptional regulator n=1 Tax=Streptomyces cinereoruber TaxID=67260 RepID=UPI003C2D94DB